METIDFNFDGLDAENTVSKFSGETPAVSSANRQPANEDLSTLSWCATEIRAALEESEAHLQRQLGADADDLSMLGTAKAFLHQAHGALQMVDLPGTTLITSGAEAVMDKLSVGELELTADVASVIGRAFGALNEYIDDLLGGAAQQPLYLFPYLKALLKIRGAERIHPADLFFPASGQLSLPPVSSESVEEVERRKIGLDFEMGLLRTLREPDAVDAFAPMLGAVQKISTCELGAKNQLFWHVLAAYFKAIVNKSVRLDVYGKRLLARVNLQLRRTLTENAPVSERLLRDTLFTIACGKPESSDLKEVFSAFSLTEIVPADFETARYGKVDRRALSSARQAVAEMKKTWETMLQQSGGVTSHIAEFKQGLSHFQDAIETLNEPGLTRITGAWVGVAKTLGLENGPVSDALGVEVATSMLFIEQLMQGALSEFQDTDARCSEMARRIDETLHDIEVSEEAPQWLRDLSASVQERLTMNAFVQEIQAALREAEAALDAFFRDPNAVDGLKSAARNFVQVSGIMQLLGFSEAANAARHIAVETERLELRTRDDPDTNDAVEKEAADLANNVGNLGFFVDALSNQGGALDDFVFDEQRCLFERRSTLVPDQIKVSPAEATVRVVKQEESGTDSLSAEAHLEKSLIELDEKLLSWHSDAGDSTTSAAISALLGEIVNGAQLTDSRDLFSQAKLAMEQFNVGGNAQKVAHAMGRPSSLIAPAEVADELPQAESQIDAELLDIFLAEADEVLETVVQASSHLQKSPSDQLTQTTMRRGFHTLKGSGRMVGLDAFGEAGWAMEQVMNLWLAEVRPANSALETLIENAVDVFSAWVQDLRDGCSGGINSDELIRQATALRAGRPDEVVRFGAQEQEAPGHAVAADLPAIEAPPSAAVLSDDLTSDEPAADDVVLENLVSDDVVSDPVVLEQAAGEGVLIQEPVEAGEEIVASGLAAQVNSQVLLPDVLVGDNSVEDDSDIVHIGENEVSRGLFEVFVAEVDEIRAQLYGDVRDWTQNSSRGASEIAVRGVHSLKGSCALVRAEPARTLADVLEQFLLAQASTGKPAIDTDIQEYDRLLRALFGSLKTFSQAQVPDADDAAVAAAQSLLVKWQTPLPAARTVATIRPTSVAEAVQSRDEFDEELMPLFVAEAQEYMPQIDENLRAWQASPDNVEIQHLLMRQLHTVKGSARMAGAMVFGQRVHEMETRVEAAIAMDHVSPGLIEELIAEQDIVSDQFAMITDPQARIESAQALAKQALGQDYSDASESESAFGSAVGALPATAPDARLARNPAESTAMAGASAALTRNPSSQQPVVRVRAEVLEKMINEAGEVSIARSRLDNTVSGLRQSLSELAENVSRLRSQLREIEVQADSEIQANEDGVKSRSSDFDPLEFDRYTRFQELTRMMAESVNDVATVQSNAARLLDDASQDMTRQGQSLRKLQHHMMGVRMVQFGSVNDRLFRVVRQSAKALNKRVAMDIVGAETETDRGVLEKMVAPLEHLLRNAVSHGIEEPTERLAAGKAEKGELRLDIRHDANELVLTLADDGAGLNFDKIRARAIKNELIQADSDPSNDELSKLIFMPGFSTAASVDQISGRGVGMDVVRSEVMALGGRIDVLSDAGKGSRFVVHLPLTTGITQVMLISVGDARYAVPAASVEHMLQFTPEQLAQGYAERAIDWQGQQVPMYSMAALVDASEQVPAVQSLSPVIILRSGGRRIAVHVDEISKGQEVVVKNVGRQAARVNGVVGGTVMGNGDVVLIVNLGQLAERVSESEWAASMKAGVAARLTDTPTVVMVVDDSVTVRKVTERLLTREGFEVILAKDGVDALRQLEEQKPDIVLSDIEMPRMDGFDFARALRKDERHQSLPIVMISSRTADKHKNFAMEIGVNEFLGKPYDEAELLRLIRAYTSKDKQTLH